MMPCSSIEYTAKRPIPNRSAISGTPIRLFGRASGVAIETVALES